MAEHGPDAQGGLSESVGGAGGASGSVLLGGAHLTVTENLLLAGRCSTRSRQELLARLERVWERFPTLAARRRQSASTLSGGERQMLALAQTVMTEAGLLLIDEASLGLAPQMVAVLFEIVAWIRDEGRSILLVEQNAQLALEVADHTYVMERDEPSRSMPPAPTTSRICTWAEPSRNRSLSPKYQLALPGLLREYPLVMR